MTVTNSTLLDVYAAIAGQTYDNTETTPDVSAGAFGTYTEITSATLPFPLTRLPVPWINGPLGFQARAFFNETRNELVIAFTGTEGLTPDNMSAEEFLPDVITDLALAASGASPRHTRMEGTWQ